MTNPLVSQLPDSFLRTFAICFLMTLASSSDPCPPASKLSPCWCTDFLLYSSKTSDSVPPSTTPQPNSTMETTPYQYNTTTAGPVSTTQSNWYTSTSEATRRKRRRGKRQIDTFSALSRASYYTVVSCNSTDTVHELEEAIGAGLQRVWVDKVSISNHRPPSEGVQVRLPNRLFRNTRMKQFEITQTPLAGTFINDGEPFSGQEHSLRWFTVNNCYLRGQLTYSDLGTIQTLGLNKLTRLRGIDLSYNELEYIRDTSFRYIQANVSTLRMSNNMIRAMDYRVFQPLRMLQSLDLSHNRLESLQRTMFSSSASRLSHLDLSGNYFTTLPVDLFANMPALRYCNISNNFLHIMPPNPWATAWKRKQLQVIDVTGNYLTCDCSLMWLPPILRSSEGNGTTTASPTPRQGQTILGSCTTFKPDSYPEHHALANLTESDLDC